MDNFQKIFNETVDHIKGNGTFCIYDELDFIHPGLEINGVGKIGLPLEMETAKKIKSVCSKAPFGMGSKTIVDELVRNTWELDTHFFKLNNPIWEEFIKKTLGVVGEGLGLENSNIKASLYKLLLYEEKSFFKKHKDSEKENGMFGTLTICLPSEFEGGELCVYFDEKESIIDFAKATPYRIPFAAFYADCDHEIKPVKSGYKLSLVYNLSIDKSNDHVKLEKNSAFVSQISKLLSANVDQFNTKVKVYILDHQYTPANFDASTLKLRDKQITQTLFDSAKDSGYYAKLCLLTHYKVGELETDEDYYGNYRRTTDDTTDGSMGEIYEEYSTLENWSDDETPSLGFLHAENIDILNPIKFEDEEPIEEEEEGYTGNAGMTMSYWYHYGAVALYPLSKIQEILVDKPQPVILEWIKYFSERKKIEDIAFIKSLVGLLVNNAAHTDREKLDYSYLATILLQLKNDAIYSLANPILTNKFEQIDTDKWLELLANLPFQNKNEIISKAIERKSGHVAEKYLSILNAGLRNKMGDEILVNHLKKLIETYSTVFDMDLKIETNQSKSNIVEQTMVILADLGSNELEAVFFQEIMPHINRNFIHQIAYPAFVNLKENKFAISKKLGSICLKRLEERISDKPKTPENWTRSIPKANKQGEIWDILIPFLKSATLEKIEYKKAQAYREQMLDAIRNENLDLHTQTIKKGTPHTLLITKTFASFEKALKYWNEDCELKNKYLLMPS